MTAKSKKMYIGKLPQIIRQSNNPIHKSIKILVSIKAY